MHPIHRPHTARHKMSRVTQRSKFRIVFSKELTNKLENFVEQYRNEDKKLFKQKWNIWVSKNTDCIENEKKNLEKDGFEGTTKDIIDKLYFSVRYYHLKKPPIKDTASASEEEEDQEKKEKKYRFSRKILEAIIDHIENLTTETPIEGFTEFINIRKTIIKDEYKIFCEKQDTTIAEMFYNKMKKTYQNKYQVLRPATIRLAKIK